MKELGIGVWSDDDGTLHLDLRAMCIGNGYEPPTPENVATLEAVARDVFGDAVAHPPTPDAAGITGAIAESSPPGLPRRGSLGR